MDPEEAAATAEATLADTQPEADAAVTAVHVLALAILIGAIAGDDQSELAQVAAVVRRWIVKLALAPLALAGTLPGVGKPRLTGNDIARATDTTTKRLLDEATQHYTNLISAETKLRLPDTATTDTLDREAVRAHASTAGTREAAEIAQRLAATHPDPLDKVWISRGDSRVRTLHRRLHGQSHPLTGDFWRWPTTGQRLAYPADPRAPLDQTIGCRCVLIFAPAGTDVGPALTPANYDVAFNVA